MDTRPPTDTLSVFAEGLELSGTITHARGAMRGLIVALHGGTYDSGYYRSGPDSLVAIAPALDCTVVALDRPGYGASVECDRSSIAFAEQSRILARAIDAVVDEYADGRPAVLIGHSIGGMLALQACSRTAAPLAGVEVSGLGEHWQPGLREMWSSLIGESNAVMLPAEAHAEVMFGPAHTHTPEAVTADAEMLRALPMPELVDVVAWSELLPSAAAQVRIPVSLTLAEHDHIWQADATALADLARHFTAAPSVAANLFPGAGHSIELHRNARAYVLRQLAFAEALFASHEGNPVASMPATG